MKLCYFTGIESLLTKKHVWGIFHHLKEICSLHLHLGLSPFLPFPDLPSIRLYRAWKDARKDSGPDQKLGWARSEPDVCPWLGLSGPLIGEGLWLVASGRTFCLISRCPLAALSQTERENTLDDFRFSWWMRTTELQTRFVLIWAFQMMQRRLCPWNNLVFNADVVYFN